MIRNKWHTVTGYPDILVGQYIVPNFISNSVSIKIDDNEFVIYSPGLSLLDSWPYKEINGLKLHVILPNAYHYLGASSWINTFPSIKLYSSAEAKKQLLKKRPFPEVETILTLTNSFSPFNGVKIYTPPGHRAGDIWLVLEHLEADTLWVTCDSFLNYERVSNQPFARFMQKILGAAPGLKMSQVVKWFILNDRQKFKSWVLDKIHSDQPRALIPSHGEVFQGEDLPTQLESLIKHRL